MRYILFCICCCFHLVTTAQNAVVEGTVFSKSGIPLQNASVQIVNTHYSTDADVNGKFRFTLLSRQTYTLRISHIGFHDLVQTVQLQEALHYRFNFYLTEKANMLDTAVVTAQNTRLEAGVIQLPADKTRLNPSPAGGIESLIKIFVGSNNELSSQYTVRGGNYDENLVYVNDFEIYRPYLVRSGQQEGLSFINPDMVNDVRFYNGGFSAKYNDKMSSVLDVTYKKPKAFGGTAYVSLLEQGVHIENASKNQHLTYSVGARNRTNQNLLKSQETAGNYVPSSSDLQAYLTYRINHKNQLDFLGNYSSTRFSFIPQYAQLSSNVFSPLGSGNVGVNIFFEGREKDQYTTKMAGLSWLYQPNTHTQLKWLISYFNNNETERYDIKGDYLIGERDLQQGGIIDQPMGAGIYHQFARNSLDVNVLNISHKGSSRLNRHVIDWGMSYDRQQLKDQLYEWEYQDSAGYHIPSLERPAMSHFIQTNANVVINRWSGFITDKWIIGEQAWIFQPGVRAQYNDLNNEWLISPRVNISYNNPAGKKDIVWKFAAGLYHQPPFYREMRRPDGSVNTRLKAQKSWQVLAGFDYQFQIKNLPFRWSAEVYYKNIWDAVSYEIDNVRIRYSGENDSKAYAWGAETRLFGELVKGAESWVSLGVMGTREKLQNDHYYNYTINDQSEIADSTLMNRGWMRRPTDRLLTLGMFIQDYLAKNENIKVYLNILYGSNLPYSIPNSIKYRNALKIDPYIRVDIGFSVLLFNSQRKNIRSYHPLNGFKNVWATVEIFNLIDRDNVIAYQFIKDFNNVNYALPNRLTPRLINFKVIAKF